MVRLQSEIKRGFLRQIVAGAKKTTSTLGEALQGFQANIFTPNFAKGKILVSTSGSGQSGSFEIGVAGRQFTQENIFALAEELFCVLADALTNNPTLADDAQPGSSDALFAVMVQDDRLGGVREQIGDFSNLQTLSSSNSAISTP